MADGTEDRNEISDTAAELTEEQREDLEFEAGFNEQESGTVEGPGQELDKTGKVSDEVDQLEQEKDNGKGQEQDQDKDKNLSLQEKIDARAKELTDKDPEAAAKAEQAHKEAEEREERERKAAEDKAEKERKAAGSDNSGNDITLESVIEGMDEDSRDNLGILFEDQPELKTLMGAMLDAVKDQKQPTNQLDTQQLDAMRQEFMDARSQAAEQMFFLSLEQARPGAKELITGKDFSEWLNGQSDSIKMLAEGCENTDDALLLLDAFGESKAGKAALKVKKENADKFKTKKDVHGGSLRPGKQAGGSGSGNDEDEFNAGWNEAEGVD